jgi:hypothetical protein
MPPSIIALDVGIFRFTHGVMLPALQRDLSLAYFDCCAPSAASRVSGAPGSPRT